MFYVKFLGPAFSWAAFLFSHFQSTLQNENSVDNVYDERESYPTYYSAILTKIYNAHTFDIVQWKG